MPESTLPSHEFKDDHDVIVAMYVKMGRVESDIKELKDTTAARVAALEHEKLDKIEADRVIAEIKTGQAVNKRNIEALQNWRWFVVGISTLGGLLIEILIRKYV